MSDNRLDQDFRIPALLKFTAPTAIMMVFMALYQMVDGAFVSRFVGENALSALNIVYPSPASCSPFPLCCPPAAAPSLQKTWEKGICTWPGRTSPFPWR